MYFSEERLLPPEEKTVEQLEQRGRDLEAAQLANRLARHLNGDDKYTRLIQAGINYRLAGKIYWTSAHGCFKEVIEETTEPELQARAMRDKAMLYIEENELGLARPLLNSASQIQFDNGLALEWLVTLGFIGRLELQEGDKCRATRILRKVDYMLGESNPVYALNNLIWLMKSERLPRRICSLPRALRLAKETGFSRRRTEGIIIAINPRLYETIKKTTLIRKSSKS